LSTFPDDAIINLMKYRIFIAINLPAEIKEELLSYQKKLKNLNVRWTRFDNLHITLAFIGYISEEEIEKILKAIQKTVSKFSPFLIELNRICLGPTPERPRMVWAKGKTSRDLINLDKKLREELSKAKINFDRKYPLKVHITLARARRNELRGINLDERLNELNFEIKGIDVMESKLVRSGAEYKILKKFPFYKKT